MGLIESFDLAVAEKALQMLRRPGFGLSKVSVSVSGASIGADTYVEGLLRMTAASPDIRSRILIEVTETVAVGDLDAASRRLTALRTADVQVCLDDFGAGAASLNYLHRLPADTVKIDGRFVRDITTDERSRSLVSHVVDLCKKLKMSTVAEMIETNDQATIRQRSSGASVSITVKAGCSDARRRSRRSRSSIPSPPAGSARSRAEARLARSSYDARSLTTERKAQIVGDLGTVRRPGRDAIERHECECVFVWDEAGSG